MVASTIGHYRVLEKLGQGAMGEVYKIKPRRPSSGESSLSSSSKRPQPGSGLPRNARVRENSELVLIELAPQE